MHAITCSTFGPPDVLEWTKVDTPKPRKNQVLIKVAAAGMNRADLLQRNGHYAPPEGASEIIGLEVSGEIAEVGEGVSRWKKGDKVCALLAGGGYAEYVAVPEGQCLPIPKSLSMLAAAGLPETVLAVWYNLFEVAGLEAGETVLVHGGASGIGTTAIQMAKLMGVKIFVTVGSAEKADVCRDLGADLAINYKNQDFTKEVYDATKGRGVEAVIDIIGGPYIDRNLKILAPYGRHISLGAQESRLATIDLRPIMKKRLTLTGTTLRSLGLAEKARLVAEVEKKVWPWVAEGKLKPLIYKTYPLKNAAEAHKMMESGEHIGKIILEA